MKYLGFIGAGNMANAIAKGILKSKALSLYEIILSDVNEDKLEKIKNELKVSTTTDNFEVVENSKYLILAVKHFDQLAGGEAGVGFFDHGLGEPLLADEHGGAQLMGLLFKEADIFVAECCHFID